MQTFIGTKIIEAVRFMGLTEDGDPLFSQTPEWLVEAVAGPEHSTGSIWAGPGQAYIGEGDPQKVLFIGTMEGQIIASKGDWIIRGIKGELYPCKADISEATYDVAGDDPGPAWKEGDTLAVSLDPMADTSISARISELGNQIHNLGCENQGYALSSRLEELRTEAWDIARAMVSQNEALSAAIAETDVDHASDLPTGSVDRLRKAATAFVIGEGFTKP